jgi:hypothetical protein
MSNPTINRKKKTNQSEHPIWTQQVLAEGSREFEYADDLDLMNEFPSRRENMDNLERELLRSGF